MFYKWLETEESASWNQLLGALRNQSVQLTRLACIIEELLDPSDNVRGKCSYVISMFCAIHVFYTIRVWYVYTRIWYIFVYHTRMVHTIRTYVYFSYVQRFEIYRAI